MSVRMSLFPLKHVVFPGEDLPLHIFEDRYKQLIEDCENSGITFGIPVYHNDRLEYGTEVELSKVVNRYPSGAKDVLCKGLKVFKIIEFDHREKGKIYAGGDVEFIEDIEDHEAEQVNQLIELISELYVHLEVAAPKVDKKAFRSFTLAHKIGLSLLQEYTLLTIDSEKERLAYLINHLLITIPIVQEMNRAKYVIELNGHFRNFDPLDFREFRLRKK